MGMGDPVVWGSILAVVISVVILGFLVYKVKNLIEKDAQAHKN